MKIVITRKFGALLLALSLLINPISAATKMLPRIQYSPLRYISQLARENPTTAKIMALAGSLLAGYGLYRAYVARHSESDIKRMSADYNPNNLNDYSDTSGGSGSSIQPSVGASTPPPVVPVSPANSALLIPGEPVIELLPPVAPQGILSSSTPFIVAPQSITPLPVTPPTGEPSSAHSTVKSEPAPAPLASPEPATMVPAIEPAPMPSEVVVVSPSASEPAVISSNSTPLVVAPQVSTPSPIAVSSQPLTSPTDARSPIPAIANVAHVTSGSNSNVVVAALASTSRPPVATVPFDPIAYARENEVADAAPMPSEERKVMAESEQDIKTRKEKTVFVIWNNLGYDARLALIIKNADGSDTRLELKNNEQLKNNEPRRIQLEPGFYTLEAEYTLPSSYSSYFPGTLTKVTGPVLLESGKTSNILLRGKDPKGEFGDRVITRIELLVKNSTKKHVEIIQKTSCGGFLLSGESIKCLFADNGYDTLAICVNNRVFEFEISTTAKTGLIDIVPMGDDIMVRVDGQEFKAKNIK